MGFGEPGIGTIGGWFRVPRRSMLLLPTLLKVALSHVDERIMERRAQRGTGASFTVKVLATFPGPSGGNSVSADLVKSSGTGMRIRLQFPVTCGAPVEISDGDGPLLGTVCSCVPDGGAYVIGVLLSHDRALVS